MLFFNSFYNFEYFVFILPIFIYLFYAFLDSLLLIFCMTRIRGDGGRIRCLLIEGTWGGFRKLPLGSWIHKD